MCFSQDFYQKNSKIDACNQLLIGNVSIIDCELELKARVNGFK